MSTTSPRVARTTLPATAYTDPQWFADEMERVFARMWLAAGRAPELDQPGAFIRRDVAGASVLIVRAGDGSIEAFHNVCRHRGTRLCTEEHGTVPGQHPVSVSRVDLRARRPADGGAANGRGGGLRSIGISAAPRRLRDVGRSHLHQPFGLTRSTSRAARGFAGAIRAVADAGAAAGPPDRVRHRDQLEAGGPELQRVPALPDHSSAVEPDAPLPGRRQRADDRHVLRRRDGLQGRRRDVELRRQAAARVSARSWRARARVGELLRDLSEPAAHAPPRLHDDDHHLAAGAPGGPGSSPNGISIRTRWRSRIRVRGRGGFLGSHQPRRLGHLRAVVSRHQLTRLPARAILGTRAATLGLRSVRSGQARRSRSQITDQQIQE